MNRFVGFSFVLLPLAMILFVWGGFWTNVACFFVLFVASGLWLVEGLRSRKSLFYPFSQKVFIMVLLSLATLQGFTWWAFALFILRDFVAGIVRLLASRETVPLRGLWLSGMLTALQFALILSILVGRILELSLLDWLLVPTVVIAIASLFQYLVLYFRGRRLRLGNPAVADSMLILANPRAGNFRDRYRRRLLRIFQQRRQLSLHYAVGAYRDVVKVAKQIILAGGDGTFEHALNDPLFAKKALGFFPMGSGNALYSYFYQGKRFEYLRERFPFSRKLLDVLQVRYNNTSVQSLFLSVGVDAEVLRRRPANKFLDYVQAAWRALWTAKGAYALDIRVDGRKYRWVCSSLSLGKIPFYGYGVRALLGRVNAADGLILGLACVGARYPKLVRLWCLLVQQFGFCPSALRKLRGKEITVSSELPFPVQAGGEFLGYTQVLRVKILRQQPVLTL